MSSTAKEISENTINSEYVLFFDMDGTLVETNDASDETINEAK